LNYDISGILRNWDYDPANVSARWIKGRDGPDKLREQLDQAIATENYEKAAVLRDKLNSLAANAAGKKKQPAG
jgi:protein-arginine kinase activator protein McsA